MKLRMLCSVSDTRMILYMRLTHFQCLLELFAIQKKYVIFDCVFFATHFRETPCRIHQNVELRATSGPYDMNV